MLDVGFSELFLLSLIGLLVLGPKRLPAVARTLGGLLRKARSSWYNLKRSIETELAAADLAEPVRSAQAEFDKVSKELSQPMSMSGAAQQHVSQESAPDAVDSKPVVTPGPADSDQTATS
jgi:sec-independent protein translocase protein TatB